MVRIKKYLGLAFLFIEDNAVDACRVKGTGYHELNVGSPSNHVDILTAQFVNDAAQTATLYADTGTYRIDAVIVALHSNLGTFARDACYLVNGDEAVLYLGYLSLQHALQESRVCAAQDDAGLAASVLYTGDDGTSGLTFTEEVARNLFLTGQQQLVALFVHKKSLAFPSLIDFGADDFTLAVLILVVEGVIFQLHDAAGECLAQLQNCATAEFGHINTLAHFLSYLVVVLYLLCLAQGDFLVWVIHFTIGHNDAVVVNLEVALVGIDNDVVVLIGAVHLGDDVAEAFLQHAHQRSAIDVVLLLEVGENLYHVYRLF